MLYQHLDEVVSSARRCALHELCSKRVKVRLPPQQLERVVRARERAVARFKLVLYLTLAPLRALIKREALLEQERVFRLRFDSRRLFASRLAHRNRWTVGPC